MRTRRAEATIATTTTTTAAAAAAAAAATTTIITTTIIIMLELETGTRTSRHCSTIYTNYSLIFSTCLRILFACNGFKTINCRSNAGGLHARLSRRLMPSATPCSISRRAISS